MDYSEIASRAADKLEKAKEISDHLNATTERLYELRCFETLTHRNGLPIAMRVPGGWIFYHVGAAGSLQLKVGDGDEEETILGNGGQRVSQVFVPYSTEFQHGTCESLSTRVAARRAASQGAKQ